MKLKPVLVAVLSATLALSATTASAYEGDWYYDDNRGGSEVLILGDYYEGFDIEFYGVPGWCGRKGASYAKMRQVISSNGQNPVYWWVDTTCGDDNYARICVTGRGGQQACSTYGVADWWWYEGE
jgi:hypothetical protein